MCGITGFISTNNLTQHEAKTVINNMASTLSHRGPDDTGYWSNESDQVALGHKRLAIIDLTTSGHQPMISSSNRFVIVFNGEIYNFNEIRTFLKTRGYAFITNSDTEVLLYAYEYWGEECNKSIRGMFAYAIYDVNKNKIFLYRDIA